MIARKVHPRHPDDPSRYVFVPLVYERQLGEWVPLLGPAGYRVSEVEAARVCIDDWQSIWSDIQQVARRLRVFCEHPSFAAFIGDGIDAEMVVDSARELVGKIEIANGNIAHLLDRPSADDIIRIGGVLYKRDFDTDLLVPWGKADLAKEPILPDELFVRIAVAGLDEVRKTTGLPVTRRGLEDIIDSLILMLPDDDAGALDPAQLITDHRFARFFMIAAHKAGERFGQNVSLDGLKAAREVLDRFIEDRGKSENGNGIVTDPLEDQVTPRIKPRKDGSGITEREIDDEIPAGTKPSDNSNIEGNNRGNGSDGDGE